MCSESTSSFRTISRLVDVEFLPVPAVFAVSHNIGNQLLFESIPMTCDGTVTNGEVLDDGGFHCDGMNSVSSNLDHSSCTSRDFQHSRGQKPSQITRLVHPSTLLFCKWIQRENLGRCFWKVDITASKQISTHVQLSGDVCSDPVSALVENVDVFRVYWWSDGADTGFGVEDLTDIASSYFVRLASAVDIE